MSNKAINWAWTQTALSSSEMLVLVAIADATNCESGECYLSQARIAARCRMTRQSVNRHLKILTSLSLIDVQYRYDEATGGRLSSIYKPTFLDPMAIDLDAKSKCDTRGKSKCDTRAMSNPDNTPVKNQGRQSQNSTEAKSADLTTNNPYNPITHIYPPCIPPLQSKTAFVFAGIEAGMCSLAGSPLQIRIPKRGAKKPKPAKRATRLPDNWTLPNDWREWAETKRPELNIDLIAERFANYWQAKAGSNACKIDWRKTWQNWVTGESAKPQFLKVGHEERSRPMSAVDRAAAGAERLLEKVRREAEAKQGGVVIEGVFDRVAGAGYR